MLKLFQIVLSLNSYALQVFIIIIIIIIIYYLSIMPCALHICNKTTWYKS
jgi:hypothetical protein